MINKEDDPDPGIAEGEGFDRLLQIINDVTIPQTSTLHLLQLLHRRQIRQLLRELPKNSKMRFLFHVTNSFPLMNINFGKFLNML